MKVAPILLLFLVVVTVRGGASRWCLPKPEAPPEKLQNVLNYVCSHMACPQPSDNCFASSNLPQRAGIAMNMYYQLHGGTEQACYFGGDGMVVTTNPSTGACVYASTAPPPQATTMILLLLLLSIFVYRIM